MVYYEAQRQLERLKNGWYFDREQMLQSGYGREMTGVSLDAFQFILEELAKIQYRLDHQPKQQCIKCIIDL